MKKFSIFTMVVCFYSAYLFAYEDSSPYQTGDVYKCTGFKTQFIYELTIVDVGDREGMVIVNDGGAPKNYENTDYHNGLFLFGPVLQYEARLQRSSKWKWDYADVKYQGYNERATCIKQES